MGGKGSGGRRPNSGRKAKDLAIGLREGSRRARARAKRQNQNTPSDARNQNARNQNAPPVASASADPDVLIPEPPGNLTLDELAVWNELAPLAAKEGTLTDSTRMALRDLCEAIVLKRRLLRTVMDDGVTVWSMKGDRAAHPLLTQFRGLMQRVEAGMLRFKLAPMGKEIPASEEPTDPFAEFDDPAPARASTETAH